MNPDALLAKKQVSREVVRLSTSYWHDRRGCHMRKSLVVLKSKSGGCDLILEDCTMTGAEEVIRRIVNLNECQDGRYVVALCNEHRDWETGHIEDYDYRLLPFVETAAGKKGKP